MGKITVLDRSGDTETRWSPDDSVLTKAAKEKFDKYRGYGYSAWSVDPQDESKAELVKDFDPQAEELLLMPQFKGG